MTRGNNFRLGLAVMLSKRPADYRLTLEIVPEPGATSFGIALRATGAAQEDACDLVFRPKEHRVTFSKMGGSSGQVHGGPSLEGVPGLEQPFTVDLIVRHDILDAEIAGFRSLATRFWNPASDRLRLFADTDAVTFRNLRIRPLQEIDKP